MAVGREAIGPDELVHVATPLTPVIAQVPIAVGATARAGPATVAVKVKELPRVAEAGLLMVIAGITPVTTVEAPDVGATL